jgi:uncharacterized membrane protein
VTESPVNPSRTPSKVRRASSWLLAGLAVLLLGVWLWHTPPGLLGKADAVGYAICHRIDERSFHIGSRQLPLCARCTGTFLGAVLGVAAMLVMRRGRAGRLPPVPVLAALALFIIVMGIDGVNSYLSLLPRLPHLYQPQNWLRLVTGMFEGLALGLLVWPIFNQTFWRVWEDRPAVANLRELGFIAVAAVALIGLVLSDNAWVLYPLALFSAAGVMMMLTLLDTVILVIVTRRENRVENWKAAVLPLLAGATAALVQVAVIDAGRFAIFGTWGGLVLPK